MKNIKSWSAFNEELLNPANRVPVSNDSNKPAGDWTSRVEDFLNPKDIEEMKKILANTNESIINEGLGIDIINKILANPKIKEWIDKNIVQLKQALPELQRLKNLGLQGFIKEIKSKVGQQPVTESAEQVKEVVSKIFGVLGVLSGLGTFVSFALVGAGILVNPWTVAYCIGFAIICGLVHVISK